MSACPVLIGAWARSAVAPLRGAFNPLAAHEIGAPVVQGLLQRAGLAADAVDAVVVGNALGAGGNPARMVALAAGLPERCAAWSVDTQCCSGLDAVAMAAGLLISGQASIVVAGGVEAWSRAPIRQWRPLRDGEPALAYERPPFSPDPQRDPDLLLSAARHALQMHCRRSEQDAYAVLSHQRAVDHAAALQAEIVPVAGLQQDAYPRRLTPAHAARMPLEAVVDEAAAFALSRLAVSAKADGAAFVLLATPEACAAFGIRPRARWVAAAALGCAPETPLLGAAAATRLVLARAGLRSAAALSAIELHDAFAVQGLSFSRELGLDPLFLNRRGGGLARGHPIGASAAVALVRVLADLERDEAPGARGLAAAAGAGGIGAAAVVERL